jgi:hypothetical protein
MGATRFMNAAPEALKAKLAAAIPQRTARAATVTGDPIRARRIAANHDFIRQHGQAAWRAKRSGLPYTPAKAQRTKAAAKPKTAKPKPAAKIDTLSAWVIRRMGTQAQIDALNAQEAAEEAAQRQARSPEGAAALASAIRRNTAAVNGNGKTMTSQAAIDRTWQDAHEKVARETGRTR